MSRTGCGSRNTAATRSACSTPRKKASRGGRYARAGSWIAVGIGRPPEFIALNVGYAWLFRQACLSQSLDHESGNVRRNADRFAPATAAEAGMQRQQARTRSLGFLDPSEL